MNKLRQRHFIEKAFGINKPKVRVSKNGKLLIDEYGNVRPNYNNPEVRDKLENQMSLQAKMAPLMTVCKDS